MPAMILKEAPPRIERAGDAGVLVVASDRVADPDGCPDLDRLAELLAAELIVLSR